jgi:hypothetical protein
LAVHTSEGLAIGGGGGNVAPRCSHTDGSRVISTSCPAAAMYVPYSWFPATSFPYPPVIGFCGRPWRGWPLFELRLMEATEDTDAVTFLLSSLDNHAVCSKI